MKKKKLFILMSILTMTVILSSLIVGLIIIHDIRKQISLDAYTETTEAPDYFLEPDGYIIARIYYNSYKGIKKAYGYISKKDYKEYQKNPDSKIHQCIKVLNPYDENGKGAVVVTNKIITLETGIYIDLRCDKNLNM